MAKSAAQALYTPQERLLDALRQIALIVGGSVFVAVCAQKGSISLLPLTPVPLTIQNFAVLLVGLLLGSRRAFAAMMLYLVEGLVGFPVFSPGGPGGIAQLFGGVTGGFLLAYPFVAFTAGYVFERGPTYIRPGRCRRDRSGGVAVHRRPGLALRFHSLFGKSGVSRSVLVHRRRSYKDYGSCGNRIPLAPYALILIV